MGHVKWKDNYSSLTLFFPRKVSLISRLPLKSMVIMKWSIIRSFESCTSSCRRHSGTLRKAICSWVMCAFTRMANGVARDADAARVGLIGPATVNDVKRVGQGCQTCGMAWHRLGLDSDLTWRWSVRPR